MTPLFITGNKNKLKEFQQVLPTLQNWEVDLPEIQDTDAREVIRAKLMAAARLKPGTTLIVEDTSLALKAMGGLPGPLTKWFVKPEGLGIEGLANIAIQRGDTRAEAMTWIGLFHVHEKGEDLRYFKGVVPGHIVLPRGDQGFGWDPIFQPEGSEKTFAEMSLQEKSENSMRRQAIEALKKYLNA